MANSGSNATAIDGIFGNRFHWIRDVEMIKEFKQFRPCDRIIDVLQEIPSDYNPPNYTTIALEMMINRTNIHTKNENLPLQLTLTLPLLNSTNPTTVSIHSSISMSSSPTTAEDWLLPVFPNEEIVKVMSSQRPDFCRIITTNKTLLESSANTVSSFVGGKLIPRYLWVRGYNQIRYLLLCLGYFL